MKIRLIAIISFVLLAAVFFDGCLQNTSKQANTKLSKAIKPAAKWIPGADTLIFTDTALAALVNKTEKLFSVFDTISPNGDPYDITKFDLDKSVLDDIRSSSGDSVLTNKIDGFIVTGVLSGAIADNLQQILSWKNIDNYNLSLLFKNQLGVVRSPDERLYCFSFDEKTGGTYKSQISIIHYKGMGDRSQTLMIANGDSVFNSDGYDSIDTINTKQGIKYLLTGNVVGCTTCMGFYTDLVHYKGGKFINDFNYHVGTRAKWSGDDDGSPVIGYDAKLHHINVSYITDDQTPACNCGKNGADEVDAGDADAAPRQAVDCVYAFNGNSFVLKKKRVKTVK